MFTADCYLEINATTKKIRIVDNTDLSTLNLANVDVTGTGTINMNGVVLYTGITIDRSAGDTESIWYNLPLASDGEIVNAVFRCTYTLNFTATTQPVGAFTDATDDYITITGADWVDIFDASAFNAVTIAGASNAGNNGSKTVTSATLVGSDTRLFTTGLTTESPTSATISFSITYASFFSTEVTYNGCTIVTPTTSASYDCDMGQYGQIVFTDTTVLPTNQVLDSKSWNVTYPQNLSNPATPAPITSLQPSVVANQLATGTWTAKLTYNVTITQTDGLVITYQKSSIAEEYVVTCTGTLCALVCCIQKIAALNLQFTEQGNLLNPYSPLVQTLPLYYMIAKEAKACGNTEKYEEYYAKMQALIDSSGACSDCGCEDQTDTGNVWINNNLDVVNGTVATDVIFAGFTPYSEDGELAPDPTILPQSQLNDIVIPYEYFDFAPTILEQGNTYGKKFVEFDTYFTADDAVTVTLTLAGTLDLLSGFSLAQNDSAHYLFRIGTKASGSSTIFCIQTVRTQYLSGGTVGVAQRYYEETDLIVDGTDMTITLTTGGSFPKELITVIPKITPYRTV